MAVDPSIEAAFRQFDLNNDGKLCHSELEQALSKLGVVVSAADVDQLLLRMHSIESENNDDDDSTIVLREFEAFFKHRQSLLLAAFQLLEAHTHQNGAIRGESVRAAIGELGLKATDAQIQRFVQAMDRNHDGSIDFAEFRDFTLLLPGISIVLYQLC
jgi:Ca2+-binding EF-hand superfamily protein